jgi:hypothetical protein
LMRRESDRGCVFILDGRVLEPRHRFFLKELPIANAAESTVESARAKLARINARATRQAVELERIAAHPTAGAEDLAHTSHAIEGGGELSLARLVRGDTDRCIHEALLHMNLLEDVRRRGLDWSFASNERSRSGRNAVRAVGVDGGFEPSAIAGDIDVDVENARADGDPAHIVDRSRERTSPTDAGERPRDRELDASHASEQRERAPEAPLEIPLEDLPY